MPSRARNGWKIHIYQVFTVRVKVRDLRKLSALTRINISRLMDEAVEDLIDKYNLDLLIEKYKEKELMKNEKKKRTSFI